MGDIPNTADNHDHDDDVPRVIPAIQIAGLASVVGVAVAGMLTGVEVNPIVYGALISITIGVGVPPSDLKRYARRWLAGGGK